MWKNFYVLFLYFTTVTVFSLPVHKRITNEQIQEIQNEINKLRELLANLQDSVQENTEVQQHELIAAIENRRRNQNENIDGSITGEDNARLEEFLSGLSQEDRTLVKSMPNKLSLLQTVLNEANDNPELSYTNNQHHPSSDDNGLHAFIEDFSDDQKRLLLSNVENKLRELTLMIANREKQIDNGKRFIQLEFDDSPADKEELEEQEEQMSVDEIKQSLVDFEDNIDLVASQGDQEEMSTEELEVLKKIKAKLSEIKSDYNKLDKSKNDQSDQADDQEELDRSNEQGKVFIDDQDIHTVAERFFAEQNHRAAIDDITNRFVSDLRAAKREGVSVDDLLRELKANKNIYKVNDPALEGEEVLNDEVERELESLHNYDNAIAFTF